MGRINKHILIQDTREQRSLEFFHPDVQVKKAKLNCGDYAFIFSNGIPCKTIFERKSIPDVISTMTKGHDRFKREMARAKVEGSKLIIIVEGTITDVSRGIRQSKVSGHSVLKTLFSLWVRYGIIPVFVRGREEASKFILHYYMAVWRKMEEQNGKK